MPYSHFDDAMPDAFNSVEPAQLSFLAIYNPRLGPTDETIQDQVVFYTSKSSRSRRIESSTVTNDDKEVNGEWNERLRQIGLAQGMVSFARWGISLPGKQCGLKTDGRPGTSRKAKL